jgi:hypothetical protein
VVVSGAPGAIEIIDRRKIVVTASNVKEANQPYHHAKDLSLPDAELYLGECATASERLAGEALRETIQESHRQKSEVIHCAILLAAGRTLPPLPKILSSHALIHTAEGEFFRQSFRRAGEMLGIEVTGIRERDLGEHAKNVFGTKADSVGREIAGLGSVLGAPWTSDQKNACLAALLVLFSRRLPVPVRGR